MAIMEREISCSRKKKNYITSEALGLNHSSSLGNLCNNSPQVSICLQVCSFFSFSTSDPYLEHEILRRTSSQSLRSPPICS